MPNVCLEPDPEPSYFDPVEFFAAHGDMAEVAQAVTEGELYRKSLLGLDARQVRELRRELARRGLVMVDCLTDWQFVRPVPPPPPPPAEAPAPCPVCGQDAAVGRTTCGSAHCLEEIGRRELAERRRQDGE